MPLSRHRRSSKRRAGMRRTASRRPVLGFKSTGLKIVFGVVAVVFIAAMVAPMFLVGTYGGGGSGIGSSSDYVEGIGEEVEVASSREHFDSGSTIGDVVPGGYLTSPPTSGQHWDGWVSCGFYYDEVPDERIVHNMEHGNVIVSYNLADAADVERLREVYEGIGLTKSWGVARPYDAIDEGTVYVATWGVLDGPIMGVDEERIEEFFEHYAGKMGPEFPNGAPCTYGGVMSPDSVDAGS